MKISTKAYGAVFNLSVAAIMSLVLTLVNAGLIPGFLVIWMQSFAVSLLVAIPVTFVAIPLVSKVLSQLFVVEEPR